MGTALLGLAVLAVGLVAMLCMATALLFNHDQDEDRQDDAS